MEVIIVKLTSFLLKDYLIFKFDSDILILPYYFFLHSPAVTVKASTQILLFPLTHRNNREAFLAETPHSYLEVSCRGAGQVVLSHQL